MSERSSSFDRPLSATLTRPESPRRPSPIGLDPLPGRAATAAAAAAAADLPPRPPSSSGSRNPLSPHGREPPSPSRAHHNRSSSVDGSVEAMHAWLAVHMPPALQAGLTSWCTSHAEPLLGGFLEGWMGLNAAQLLQNELAKHLLPMQAIMQQQQQMIADLQRSAHEQQGKIAQLEETVTALAARPTPPPAEVAAEPAPFTPTLPFALSGSSSMPPASNPTLGFRKQSAGPHGRPGLGLGLGLGSQSQSMASQQLSEDGVAAPTDLKDILRKRMMSTDGGKGLGIGLGRAANDPRGPLGSAMAHATTAPGPGETISSEEAALSGLLGQKKLGLSPGAVPRTAPVGGRSKAPGQVDIIVVEDLGVARKIAHAALTRGHYKVDVAEDGLAAIELFKKYMGGLKAVLMDIHLPGISGIETTERIRVLEQEAGVQPVWIYGLTGDVAEEDLIKYKACGMNGCILKGKLLADAVKQAMEESQNGVEFVNLCDKQGGSTSNGVGGSSSGLSSPTGDKAHAVLEKIRQDAASSQASNVYGTPRAPLPRQLMLDNKYPGHGQLRPGLGLPGSGGGNSPGTTERQMVPPSSIGPNMLLVEDVRVSRRIALQALSRANYKVIGADDGESAVTLFKQHATSLRYIIMDINLPGISGIEATEQIRVLEKSLGLETDLFIFGLTGNVDAESMRNYEAAGMNGCILKGKVLADAVKQAIEEAQEGRFVNIS